MRNITTRGDGACLVAALVTVALLSIAQPARAACPAARGGAPLAASALHSSATVPTIATIAGDGPQFPDFGGFSGDDGLAVAAGLNHPAQIAALADGGYLIADSGNHRIRRVSPAGCIATVAGDGRQCPLPTDACGDGGPAIRASLNVPHDIAALPDGGFLIADSFDHRVRRVEPDGRISSVAGRTTRCPRGGCVLPAPARHADLTCVAGAAPLPSGAILVAECGAARVLLIDRGVASIVAGTGVAGFRGDGGPAIDAELDGVQDVAAMADGGFVIADGRNCRLRRVTPDGTITTIAGSGLPGLCAGYFALAPAAAGQRIGAAQAQLNTTGYLSVAGDGQIVFTDVYDDRVLALTPDGSIEALAGAGGEATFGGDGGPAIGARLAWPSGVALTDQGALLLTDSGNNRVRRVDLGLPPPRALPSSYRAGARPALAWIAPDTPKAGGATRVALWCPPAPGDPPCVGSASIRRGGRVLLRRSLRLHSGARSALLVPAEATGLAHSGQTSTFTLATRQPSGASVRRHHTLRSTG